MDLRLLLQEPVEHKRVRKRKESEGGRIVVTENEIERCPPLLSKRIVWMSMELNR
jgi:hypothetical protein